MHARRLIYKAQTDRLPQATVGELVEGVFAAYFSHGENIGDPAVLGRIAHACGQDETSVSAFLLGDDLTLEVEALTRLGGSMGIGGVPCFVFKRSIVLPGAQPSTALNEAMHHSVAGLQIRDRPE